METPNPQQHRSISYQPPNFNTSRLYDPTTVTIIVNDSDDNKHQFYERVFTVPCELICRNSEYFRATFEGKFVEAEQKKTTITDVHPGIFTTFVDFLYLRELSPNDDNPTEWEWHYLIDCYIFAEKYLTPLFQHLLVEAIQTKLSMRTPTHYTFPTGKVLTKLYSHTPASSPLRRILVDGYVTEYQMCNLSEEKHTRLLGQDPPEFVASCLDFSLRWADAQACPHCRQGGDGRPCPNAHRHGGLAGDLSKTRWCLHHRHSSQDEQQVCQARRDAVQWKFIDPPPSTN